MATLDDLPADQSAVLQLLLKQGKSYEEIAALLRDRARGRARPRPRGGGRAGPRARRRLPEPRRAEIGDYLLGQQERRRGGRHA